MTNLVFCLLTFFGTLFILVEIPAFFRQILILFWVSLQIIRLSKLLIKFRSISNIPLLSNGDNQFAIFDWSVLTNYSVDCVSLITLY